MNRFIPIGLLVAAAMVGGLLWLNRGARVMLDGSVQSVRLQEIPGDSTIAVLDFRFVNDSNYPFWVREVEVFVEDDKGERHAGDTVSDAHMRGIFDYYKLTMGEKYNDSLFLRQKFAPGESADRMIAASFPMRAAQLERRKRFVIRVSEVDGAIPSEIAEVRTAAPPQ